MSAKLTMPASARADHRGLLSETTTAAQDIETLVELSQYSNNTYPQTPVFFHPILVGYDTAANRQQWEVTYREDTGGHWASGKLLLYSEWHTKSFDTNTAGVKHSHRLGLFVTESEGWVGQPGGMWIHQEWHAWGACLYPDPDRGKRLVFFDSNVENIITSDEWTKERPDSENDLEPKQRKLLNYLRQDRKVNITQVWVGGEGNTNQGLCFPLTYDWCKRVIDLQGLPTTAEELTRLGYYQLTGKTGARGKAPTERKPYVKKEAGGDGRGGLLVDEAGSSSYQLRPRG